MKILHIATLLDTIDTFMTPHIKSLTSKGISVDIAGRTVPSKKLNPDLTQSCKNIYDIPFSRSPLSKENLRAYQEVKLLLKNQDYDIIHCHTPNAAAIVRLAARSFRKTGTKVFYTAHGFHFFKGAPLLNWLVYYPVEKICSYFTDVLITMNQEDFSLAKKRMRAQKNYHISGIGVNTSRFSGGNVDKTKKRAELGMPRDAVLLLSVGELNKNKNHKVIIKALGRLKDENIYYLIAGEGGNKDYLLNLARKENLADRVKLLGFREDVPELCKAADIFCFPSKREGIGVAAIEGMASGLPTVISYIRGLKDYSKDGITSYTCKPNSIKEFETAIKKLVPNSDLRRKFGENNIVAAKVYDINNVIAEMEQIYRENGLSI